MEFFFILLCLAALVMQAVRITRKLNRRRRLEKILPLPPVPLRTGSIKFERVEQER